MMYFDIKEVKPNFLMERYLLINILQRLACNRFNLCGFFHLDVTFEASLLYTDKGRSCSDSGLYDLSNEKECSDAVIYAISFNRKSNFTITGSWEDYPKGCSIYDNGNMYFNSHPMGTRDSNARSICMIGKESFRDSFLF